MDSLAETDRTPAGALSALARYAATETLDRLPADVAAKAGSCLRDSIGCLLGAHATPVADTMRRYVADAPGKASHLVGSRLVTDCATAAHANAMMINALDFDDIYRQGHPGATVVAAALAVGERLGVSGRDLLEAVVVGYEVGNRIGLSLTRRAPRKTVHGHGVWQTFGAAATAARLLRLDAARTAHALALAGANAPVASVMKTVYGAAPTMAKNNFGTAAQVGVTAALQAGYGFQGPLDLFEGDAGFWRMAGADEGDAAALTRGLGTEYELREVGFKPYSCCRLLQASVEAAVTVFADAGIDPADAGSARLAIHGPPIICAAPFADRRPDTMWAAQFSAPYAIATALLSVPPGPAWFAPSRFRDPATTALMDRIDLIPADREPSHRAAVARLHESGGRTFEARVDIAKGEAANPLPEAQLDAKFLALATPLLGAGAAEDALAEISRLDEAASLDRLLGLLTP